MASSLGTPDFGTTGFDATDMSVQAPPAPVRPEPPIFAETAVPPVGPMPVRPVLAGPATSPPAVPSPAAPGQVPPGPESTTGPVPASPPSKGGRSGGTGHRKKPGGRPGRVKRYGR